MGDLVRAGEITVTGRAALAGGMWVATGHVAVRRGIDVRDIDLPVTGRVFPEQNEAVSAGVHAGIEWVNLNFPTQS
jgi:hypothetical protein